MFVTCSNCNGSGRRSLGNTTLSVECKICHGKGGFNIDKDMVICSHCNGLGRYPTEAANCTTGWHVCSHCHGTGMMDK